MSTAEESDQGSEPGQSDVDSVSDLSWGPVDLAELVSQLTELTEELNGYAKDMQGDPVRGLQSRRVLKATRPLGSVAPSYGVGCTSNNCQTLTQAHLPRLSPVSTSRTQIQPQRTLKRETPFVTGLRTGQPSRVSRSKCVSKTGVTIPSNTIGQSYKKNTRVSRSAQTSSGTRAAQQHGTSTSRQMKLTEAGTTDDASMESTKTSSM